MVNTVTRAWRALPLAATVATLVPAAGAGSLGAGIAEGNRVRSVSLTGGLPLVENLPFPVGCTAALVLQTRIAYWWMPYDAVPGRQLWDFGVVPALRMRATLSGGSALVFAAGVGGHYLTRESIGNERRFGSHLQFGEFLEVGVAEALHGADVLLRLEHLSNGATAVPNNGVTFFGLEVRVPLGAR